MTGLHIASQKNNLEMIRLLLSYNSNPMSKDMSGMTPLGYVIKHHNLDGVKVNNLYYLVIFRHKRTQ
jgi:ankyrin repeat protein